MSHKIRLNRLEKMGSGDRLWALVGIGKPRDAQHQRTLERQARQRSTPLEATGKLTLPSCHLMRSLMVSMAMSRKVSSLK